jgi:uncharacterized membrane protein
MWFYFALLSALTNAVGTVARRTHGSLARPVELAWYSQLVMVPCGLGLVAITPHPLWRDQSFILPTVASGIIYTFATVLLFVAYKYSQISVVTPLGNLLPVGLLVASFFMFGTVPPVAGVFGVLLVGSGLYYSSVSGKHTLFKPFQALWSQRGSRAMLGVVFLWTIGTNLDKISLRSVAPAFMIFCQVVIGSVILTGLPGSQA